MLRFKGRVKFSSAWFTSSEKYTRSNTKVSTLGASGRLFSFFNFFYVFFLAYLSFLIFPTTTCGLKSKGEEIWGRFAIPAGWGLWGERASCIPAGWGLRGERTSWTDRSGRPAWAGAGQGLGSPLTRGLSAEGARVPGQEGQAQSGGPRAGRRSYLRPPRGGRPGEAGAGASGVHGTVVRHVQGPVEVLHVHQRIQSLGFPRAQHVGLDAIDLAQLGGCRGK